MNQSQFTGLALLVAIIFNSMAIGQAMASTHPNPIWYLSLVMAMVCSILLMLKIK